MNQYEIMYIIRPNIEEEAKAALVERFNTVLTENGAEVLETKEWGKKRLAYEINDFKDGFYQIIHLRAEDAKATREFDRLAKISEDVIRHLIVKEEV